MMRAFLFASATATTVRGLRSSMRASQEPTGAPCLAAQRTTAIAPGQMVLAMAAEALTAAANRAAHVGGR